MSTAKSHEGICPVSVRLSVVVESEALAMELGTALAHLDASFQIHPVRGDFFEQAASPADLLLISYNRLPAPAVETVTALCKLPGSPRVIVLVDNVNTELEAKLAATNVTAVVNTAQESRYWVESIESIVTAVRAEIEQRARIEMEQPRALLSDFRSENRIMQRFLYVVSRVATADSSLLILGETGVGKERLGRAIHEASHRSKGPFVPVNCAAFPETLLEAELFGHEQGAFTGAVGDRRGYFELAHGGTLFLDEIGEVHRFVQVKLLRVLQERVIQRLGGEHQIPINVRIMAATNRDLKAEIKQGRFRSDLYYRLSVVSIVIPSLRERPDDVPSLLEKYLKEIRETLGRPVEGFTDEAIAALVRYDWPGNVRELINVVERSLLLCAGHRITLADLPPEIVTDSRAGFNAAPRPLHADDWLPPDWRDLHWVQLRQLLITHFENEYIRHHLLESRGRIGNIAKHTGLSNRAVSQMIKRQGMHKEDYRDSTAKADR